MNHVNLPFLTPHITYCLNLDWFLSAYLELTFESMLKYLHGTNRAQKKVKQAPLSGTLPLLFYLILPPTSEGNVIGPAIPPRKLKLDAPKCLTKLTPVTNGWASIPVCKCPSPQPAIQASRFQLLFLTSPPPSCLWWWGSLFLPWNKLIECLKFDKTV